MVKTSLQPSTSLVQELRVETVVVVATTLSLNLSPTSALPGATITWSGQLTRADGLPTGIQTVILRNDMSGEVIGTASTDDGGVFSSTFVAPVTDGSYFYFTQFDGAVMGTAFLAPSSSFARGVTYGIPYLQIGLPLVVGAVLVGISVGK